MRWNFRSHIIAVTDFFWRWTIGTSATSRGLGKRGLE